MKRKEIEKRLRIEFGFIDAGMIMSVLYPNKYGKGKGDIVTFRRPQ